MICHSHLEPPSDLSLLPLDGLSLALTQGVRTSLCPVSLRSTPVSFFVVLAAKGLRAPLRFEKQEPPTYRLRYATLNP